jgi:phosphoribosylanthranilate isomerase
MMVKICGITNRDDALAAVEAGAAAIGFNFYPDSPRYISPTGAALIAEKIPVSVWKVGIFVSEGAETVAKIALNAGLDVAQLYGTAEARGIRIWRACRTNEGISSGLSDKTVEALLLDAPSESEGDEEYGGTGRTFDWPRAKGVPKKIIIAGGLDASNVARAIEEAQPWGVDACSRLEKSPGLKDHDKMRQFIRAAMQS